MIKWNEMESGDNPIPSYKIMYASYDITIILNI